MQGILWVLIVSISPASIYAKSFLTPLTAKLGSLKSTKSLLSYRSRRLNTSRLDRWRVQSMRQWNRLIRSFRLRSKQRISVTHALMVVNAFIFIITKGVPSLWIDKPLLLGNYALLDRLMKSNIRIQRGEYQRVFTSLFCHGNAFHLCFNLFALQQVGTVFEYLFGPKHMLFVYLCSGGLANYGTYVLNTSANSIGASACIFGLYGSLLAEHNFGMIARRGVDIDYIQRQLIINIIYGLSASNVDNAAHILGFLSGGILQTLFPMGMFLLEIG